MQSALKIAERMQVLGVAREMLARDGLDGARLAHDRADAEAQAGDLKSATAWRIIGGAINQLARAGLSC